MTNSSKAVARIQIHVTKILKLQKKMAHARILMSAEFAVVTELPKAHATAKAHCPQTATIAMALV